MAAEHQQTKVAAGGSRFAAACGLLRQYVMEQGGGGRGAGVTMTRGDQGVAAAEERIKKTMELFPQRAGTLKDNSPQRILQPERAQLTIFYGGGTVVFDNFPADKADDLMKLASSFVAAGAEPVCPDILVQPFLADMPIARKVSLKRFLQKRKSRHAAADPYQPARAAKDTTGKPVEDSGAPWLGINSVTIHLK